MKKLLFLLPALIILFSYQIFAQEKSDVEFILPEMKITQNKNKKSVIYDFENDRNIFILNDSLLIADPDKYKYTVPIADIKKISILEGNKSWRGAKVMGLVGGGLGLITGILASLVYRPNFAEISITLPGFVLAGILAGGIIGGILGSAIPHFEEYSKFSNDLRAKKEILKRIFKKHNLQ